MEGHITTHNVASGFALFSRLSMICFTFDSLSDMKYTCNHAELRFYIKNQFFSPEIYFKDYPKDWWIKCFQFVGA